MTRAAAAAAAACLVLAGAAAGGPAGPPETVPPAAPPLEGARVLHVEAGAEAAAEAARRRREADALRERLAREDAARRGLAGELARLDQQLALARAEAGEAEASARAEAEREAAARERVDALSTRVASARRRAAAIVEALYRSAPSDPVTDALAGRATGDAGAAVVARRQVEAARELEAAVAALEAARADAERRRAAAERWRAVAGERLGGLEAARGARERRLRDLARDASALRQAADELESARTELQGRLAASPPAAGPPVASPALPGLEGARGRLPWPLARAVVIERYGPVVHPTRGTRTFRHGVVLEADRGEAVRAIAPGRVAFVDWYKGFGRTLLVDHGSGWLSVHAHLDSVAVEAGRDVREGDLLGEAGDTGSLEGPRLYFQLVRDGKAVDPAAWLGP